MISIRKILFIILGAFSLYSGCAMSAETIIETDIEGQPIRFYSKSRALLFGFSKYDNSSAYKPLPTVPKELNDVKGALLQHGFDVQIELNKTGGQAKQILQRFLLDDKDPEARLLVYFAGHGASDSDTNIGYVVPSDAPSVDDPAFSRIAIGMDEIKVFLNVKRASAKHIMVIFDTCLSGLFFETRVGFAPKKRQLYLYDINKPARYFITAGNETQNVPGISKLVPFFVKGLGGDADLYPDGLITGEELGEWIRQKISEEGEYTPLHGTVGDPSNFRGQIVFLNPRGSHIRLPTSKPAQPGSPGSGEVVPQLSRAQDRSVAAVAPELRHLPLDPEDKSIFKGVDIRYFKKKADHPQLEEKLLKEGIPLVVKGALLPDQFEVNAIACSPDVPVGALKKVAHILLDNHVPLKLIFQVANPKVKPRRIEILSAVQKDTQTGQFFAHPGRVLTRSDIETITSCPAELERF